jgi:hypothetical protein
MADEPVTTATNDNAITNLLIDPPAPNEIRQTAVEQGFMTRASRRPVAADCTLDPSLKLLGVAAATSEMHSAPPERCHTSLLFPFTPMPTVHLAGRKTPL